VTTYVDSSALVSVYVTERFSKAARAAVRRASQVPYTPLHQLEVPNAFEMLVGRGAITRNECDALLGHLREDVEAHRLMTVSPDLEPVFARASEFSRLYTAKTLARSLDLLHVAAAHVAACTRFVSGDDRQLAVAKASGLDVVDIKRRVRRSAPQPRRRNRIS
jgi:predicted nucleic acid-binding protein